MSRRSKDVSRCVCGQKIEPEVGVCPGLVSVSYATKRHINALRKRKSLWTSERLAKLLESYTSLQEGGAWVEMKALAAWLAPQIARRPKTRKRGRK